VCGDYFALGDLVKFKLLVIEVGGKGEEAIKIRDCMESCHVGFLPRHFVHGCRKEAAVNTFGQVLDLNKDSNDMINQRKNRRLFGAASFRLLDNIQDIE
jgi:hypothetical protein